MEASPNAVLLCQMEDGKCRVCQSILTRVMGTSGCVTKAKPNKKIKQPKKKSKFALSVRKFVVRKKGQTK